MEKLGLIVTIAFMAIYGVYSAPPIMKRNTCYCAAMNSTDPADLIVSKPITFTFPCNENGDEACKDLCFALATSSKANPNGRNNFCEYHEKDGTFQVNVFSRACDREYIHTGFASGYLLCCKNKKSVPCFEHRKNTHHGHINTRH